MADTTTDIQIVNLTEAAQNMGRKFLSQEEDPTNKVLRVRVESGGCFGFQYAVELDVKKDDDHLQSYEGFEVAVETPVHLTSEQRDLLEKFDESLRSGGDKHSPRAGGWLDTVKRFFERISQ